MNSGFDQEIGIEPGWSDANVYPPFKSIYSTAQIQPQIVSIAAYLLENRTSQHRKIISRVADKFGGAADAQLRGRNLYGTYH